MSEVPYCRVGNSQGMCPYTAQCEQRCRHQQSEVLTFSPGGTGQDSYVLSRIKALCDWDSLCVKAQNVVHDSTYEEAAAKEIFCAINELRLLLTDNTDAGVD